MDHLEITEFVHLIWQYRTHKFRNRLLFICMCVYKKVETERKEKNAFYRAKWGFTTGLCSFSNFLFIIFYIKVLPLKFGSLFRPRLHT